MQQLPPDFTEQDLDTEFVKDTFQELPFQVTDRNGVGINIAEAEFFGQIKKDSKDGKKIIDLEFEKTDEANGWAKIKSFQLTDFEESIYYYDIVCRLNNIELTRIGGNFKTITRGTEIADEESE